MERLRTASDRRASDPLDALNEQEHKIIELIAEGKTNKEIAAEVFLSDKTVKNYVSSILTKLNLRRRSEAAAFIARRDPPRPRDDGGS
jgi:DNA-binding NarL/FixJ family response regulator